MLYWATSIILGNHKSSADDDGASLATNPVLARRSLANLPTKPFAVVVAQRIERYSRTRTKTLNRQESGMRFCQLDRITELVPGKKLAAVKALSLSEDYLQDHFPRFPVMPGVLMLEAMFQAGMWLIYATDNFQHSSVVLAESRQVKFGDFVEPGSQLNVTANWKKVEGDRVEIQAQGLIQDRVAVKGKLILEYFNLSDRGLAAAEIDDYLIQKRITQFRRLQDPRNPYNSPFAKNQPSSLNGQIG